MAINRFHRNKTNELESSQAKALHHETYNAIQHTKTYEDLHNKNSKLIKHPYKGIVALRIDQLLFDRIQSLVNSSKLNGDFKYPTMVAFLKTALLTYQRKNFHLSYQRSMKNRKKFSFRLDNQTALIYNNLPTGNRTEIIERILGTYYQLFIKNAN